MASLTPFNTLMVVLFSEAINGGNRGMKKQKLSC
jgi:hypothetical protein